MKDAHRISAMLICLALISACSVRPVKLAKLPPNTLEATESIGVMWLSRCAKRHACIEEPYKANSADFVAHGLEGSLWVAAAYAADQKLIKAVKKLKSSPIIRTHFIDVVAKAIEGKNLSAFIRSDPIYPGDLKPLGTVQSLRVEPRGTRQSTVLLGDSMVKVEYDFSAIAGELNTDYLLVLQVIEYGVRRVFGAFGLPTSAPYTAAGVRAYMINSKTGELLLDDVAYYEMSVDEDFERRNYRSVLEATNTALTSAVSDVTRTIVTAIQKQ